jgi:hypothetical protein
MAFASEYECDPQKTKIQKIQNCRDHLKTEFKKVLLQDSGLINTRLTLTALKFIKMMSEKNLSGTKAFNQLLNEFSQEELLQDQASVQANINNLYSQRENKQKSLSHNSSLERLQKGRVVGDAELSEFIINHLESLEEFELADASTLWFVHTVSKINLGTQSTLMSELVQRMNTLFSLIGNEQKEKELIRNIAISKIKVVGELNKIKNKVFSNHRCDCIEDYKSPINSQNNSILLSCRKKEIEIIEDDFLFTLDEMLKSSPRELEFNNHFPLRFRQSQVKADLVRKKQDELNTENYTDHERIVEYYRSGLYPDKGKCQTFTIVDKKKQTTTIYAVDGTKIFSTNSIQARPRYGENQVLFNPDGELRLFSNGTYTQTTSAGTFFTVKDLPEEERKKRIYDKEFNDRVFLIATRDGANGNFTYDDKITIAVHGVPINGFVKNARERLESFEGENRNLSTGCVNLEGYAFDMIDEMSQNHCPLYILPEDPNNYYYVKNRELIFSTSIEERKTGRESAKRCQGYIRLIQGKPICEGTLVDDPKNINRYYFGDVSSNQRLKGFIVKGSPQHIEGIFNNKQYIINELTNKNIDEEDFMDLASLSYALNPDSSQYNIDLFKDLYNSYYHLNKNYNFDKVSQEQKRTQILEFYFQSIKSNQEKPIRIKHFLEKAKEVNFIYEN